MESDHYVRIYRSKAKSYHRLIDAEDVEGNLLSALQSIAKIRNAKILDLGGGTGRLPLLLDRYAKKILSVDLHHAMLREQLGQKAAAGGSWITSQADLRQLPLPNDWADITMAGWAIGHFQSWYQDRWQQEVDTALAEMNRVAKTGALAIILETMGTGMESPKPPTSSLGDYYAYLEGKHNFHRHVISTDYQFADLDEATRLIGFFFGEDIAEKVIANHWVRVPEWTGIWHKQVE